MFHDWDNYYLLIGSAAGALIGLMFVVATLTAGLEESSLTRGARIYTTPTVFHFAVVLVVSAICAVPRLSHPSAGVMIGAAALAGLVYASSVALRIYRGEAPQTPHWTDFWCYGAAPSVIYLGLLAATAMIWTAPAWAPYGVALALIMLLLVSIRNAWDLVTWMSVRRPDETA